MKKGYPVYPGLPGGRDLVQRMHKGQPGHQIARPGRRVLWKMEQVTRKMCKFNAPTWPAKLNPGQAFVRERYVLNIINKMRSLQIIQIFALLLVCLQLNSQNNLDNDLFKKHFTQHERNELGKIISFTDSLILVKNKYLTINNAYHYYIDSIMQLPEQAFNEEIVYPFIFNLDSSLFNQIWIKNKTVGKVRTRDTILYHPDNFITIDLNRDGEFVKLLKDLGDTSMYYQSVYESIQAAGDITPTIYAYFFHYNMTFDFENIFNRIWASILLLSIEESTELKVKKYLSK